MTIDGYPAIPLTKLEHVACFHMMACEICARRCYVGAPGHYFDAADGNCPCACGQFKNITEAQVFYADEEDMKELGPFAKLAIREMKAQAEWAKGLVKDLFG